MKSQIELLTLQHEQLSQSLSRVESEKAPILLSAAPANKRKRAAEASAVICGEASANDATSASTAGQVSSAAGTAGAHTMHAAKQGTGAGADEAAKAGGGGGYGCVREVDWEVVLGGRRCKLVQAALPLEVLAKMHAESKKRYRARDGLSALRDSNFFLGKERPKTHKEIAAARAQAAAQQQLQTPVSDVKGNVTNGGRKLVTSSGQKVIIKFSAKNPGLSPRTPTPQVKNGRNGLTPRGTADTPVSSHKKQRGMLGLMDSKVSRSMDSPRNNKQDWGKCRCVLSLLSALRLFVACRVFNHTGRTRARALAQRQRADTRQITCSTHCILHTAQAYQVSEVMAVFFPFQRGQRKRANWCVVEF